MTLITAIAFNLRNAISVPSLFTSFAKRYYRLVNNSYMEICLFGLKHVQPLRKSKK